VNFILKFLDLRNGALHPTPEFSLQGQDDGQKKTSIDTIPLATFLHENLQGRIYFVLFIKVWQNLRVHRANFSSRFPQLIHCQKNIPVSPQEY